jgi:hypothetical protein
MPKLCAVTKSGTDPPEDPEQGDTQVRNRAPGGLEEVDTKAGTTLLGIGTGATECVQRPVGSTLFTG